MSNENMNSDEIADKLEKKPVNTIFPNAADDIRKRICPTCTKPVHVENFKDTLSLKEYNISGMCQECQDEVFG